MVRGDSNAKCVEVLDRHPQLGHMQQTAVCRGWLCCKHCSEEVVDGRCRYGAHSVSPRVEAACEDLVRGLAEAEGRDASSFKGFNDADKSS
jgi:hypothetical protein